MLESCKTSQETFDNIAAIVEKIPLKEVQQAISENFYNVDDIVEFLYLTLTSKGNGILHGPGGFGKSQVTKAFLDFYDIPTIVKVGHSGMDIESLLGIPNMKKLTEESIYEVAFENSVFLLPGVLILEEFLDVRPTVAAALKDILTEGGYRQGNQFIDSRIGSVIICSNKSPEEVSVDLSTAAFYKERFPYSLNVFWDDFSVNSYLNLFKTVYDDINQNIDLYKLIAEICSASCFSDTTISPRIAFKAVDIFKVSENIESLKLISSLDLSKIDEIRAKLNQEKQFILLNKKFTKLIEQVNNFTPISSKGMIAFYSFSKKLKKSLQNTDLQGDLLLKTTSSLIDAINNKLSSIKFMEDEVGLEHQYSLGEIQKTNEDIQKYLS